VTDPEKESTPWYRDPWEWLLRVSIYSLATTGVLLAFLRDAEAWKQFWDSISGQTAAAWVQAFGSIAAILGAMYVASMQMRGTRENELKLARFNLVKRYVAIRTVVQRVGYYCKVMDAHFTNLVPGKEIEVFSLPEFLEFSEYKELVQGFDLVEMPRPVLIEQMSSLASYLGVAARAVASANSQIKSGAPLNSGLWPVLKTNVDYARDEAIKVFHECNGGLTHLGANQLVVELHEMFNQPVPLAPIAKVYSSR